MIRTKGKDIMAVTAGGHLISFVRKGVRLVWQAISSCFGAGYWIDENPWCDDDGWKD